jgi:RNA recognition motif-containing protein
MVDQTTVENSSKDDVVVVVENLPNSINNQQLRKIFEPLGAKKCRVVYRKTQFMGM